jgi:hypothetical protein
VHGYRRTVGSTVSVREPRLRSARAVARRRDEEIAWRVCSIWNRGADRYWELRSAATLRRAKVEMSQIGG